jgi:hypothetical protein
MSRDVKTASCIYPNPIATARKLLKAVDAKARNKLSNKRFASVESWLLIQDSYTLHRPVRKRFSRNPYIVIYCNSWEADIMDVQNIAKHNNGVKYLLSVIYIFSKFLHLVPLKTKQTRLLLRHCYRIFATLVTISRLKGDRYNYVQTREQNF